MGQSTITWLGGATTAGEDWPAVERSPKFCQIEVSRKGEAQPCGALAVAVLGTGGSLTPACAYHANNLRLSVLALPEIIRLAQESVLGRD